MRTWLGWMVLVAIGGSGLLAQEMKTQAQMHRRIVALYNFSPAKVTEAERAAKSAEMDSFWNDVKTNQAKTMPLLRVELRDVANPAFFMQDGSALLLSLSRQRTTRLLQRKRSLLRILVMFYPARTFMKSINCQWMA